MRQQPRRKPFHSECQKRFDQVALRESHKFRQLFIAALIEKERFSRTMGLWLIGRVIKKHSRDFGEHARIGGVAAMAGAGAPDKSISPDNCVSQGNVRVQVFGDSVTCAV